MRLHLSTLMIGLLLTGAAFASADDARRFAAAAPGEFPQHILLDSPTGRCSANIISDAGHVLTARHCLMRCLVSSGVFRFHKDESGHIIQLLNPEVLGTAACELELDGRARRAYVVATAPGFLSQLEERSFRMVAPARFDELVREGFTSRGDYAILRVPELAGRPCRPLARELPRAGDAVFSAAFPGATKRPDGRDSDGVAQFKTAGSVIAGIHENACLREWAATAPAAEYDRRLQSLRESFDEPGSFLTDTDAVPGASGSGIWNERGEIVGILTNAYRHAATTRQDTDEPNARYCAGSSLALSGARIRELLADLPVPAGAASWDEALRCGR